MPAPPALTRSAMVPCGLNSSSSSPARYWRSNSLFSPTYEEIILRIWRLFRSKPSPAPSMPALLETTVKSFTPRSCSAAISRSGTPHRPNPPHISVMPSCTTPRKALAASGYTFEPRVSLISPLKAASPPPAASGGPLVAIVLGLVRTLFRDADVLRLAVGELRELRAELRKLQPRHLLVQMLGQHIHTHGILLRVAEKLDLCQHLIGERGAHHVGRVS